MKTIMGILGLRTTRKEHINCSKFVKKNCLKKFILHYSPIHLLFYPNYGCIVPIQREFPAVWSHFPLATAITWLLCVAKSDFCTYNKIIFMESIEGHSLNKDELQSPSSFV